MAQLGIGNMSVYVHKMTIEGYAVNLDTPELRELTSEMKGILKQRKPDCQTAQHNG